MALAIQCEQLIRDGVIRNQSELACYAQVTTTRMTHIMWLMYMAPGIQEAILFLLRIESRAGHGQGDRGTADRSGDGLGCAAGDVEGARLTH
ncbi:hypothetical protein N9B79_00335 [bacterium]|nr:hypothetical protein [bacterium]